jgi:hypothetical protein
MAAAESARAPTLAADLDSAWTTITHATVDVQTRQRDWRIWTTYCADNGYNDPFLQNQQATERLQVLLGFAARCRSGVWGRGRQIRADTVAVSVRHIGQTYELAGYPDPRKPERGGPDMHIAFTRLYHAYRGADPASEPQLALPLKVFLDIVEHEGASADPLEQAISDFVTIAFYFLLRVGEYTCPASTKKTRTIQFRRNDVTFWRELPTGQTYRLSSDAPLESLLAATSVTLRLSNQKNGVRDATLTHEPVEGNFCPVKATARRYAASRQACPANPFAMLGQYAPTKVVTAKHIGQVLQRAAFRTTIWMEGFELDRIGPHSIRASGAMHLYLNNVPEATIMNIGRWQSRTWLTYIHNQIAAVTAGVSRIMSRPIPFYNTAVRQPITR